MNKNFIFSLLSLFLLYSLTFSALADNVNQRLSSCTPSKNLSAGGSTLYQISGLTGSTCIFKIEDTSGRKANLICKVPINKMSEMTSFNPVIVQNAKNRYCVISLKNSYRTSGVYF